MKNVEQQATKSNEDIHRWNAFTTVWWYVLNVKTVHR